MSDWTKELNVEHPELFFDAFEARLAQTPEEVDVLLRYLNEQGFTPHRILDLNCGVGRHALELGRRGMEVLGTDISPHFIEVAQQRAQEAGMGNVHFKVADMREVASILKDERPFDGIINLWTAFGYYDETTNRNILRQCTTFVRPGGFFVIDIVNKDWILLHFHPHDYSKLKDRIVLEERSFDAQTSRLHNIWTYLKQKDERTFVLEHQLVVDHQIWSPEELGRFFEEAGWSPMKVYPGVSFSVATPIPEAMQFLLIAAKG